MADETYPVPKPIVRVQAGSNAPAPTQDSFANFMSRVGFGPGGGSNPSQGSTYGFNPLTRNRTMLEWMYRGSWIVQRAVDAIAEDMTRKGVEFKGVQPDENELLDQQMAITGVWTGIEDTIRWARLFGGAIGIMLIDGQDTATPLRTESIGKDQFKGILTLDRWVAWPNLNDLVTDLGPELGKPRFYDIPAGMPGVPRMKVHHSRCIRLEGHNLPYFQRWSENGWGASIIEVLYDRLVAFDSTTQGTAQLVYRAHLRTMKVQKLREIIAAGGPPMEALMAQMEMVRRFQVNEGLTLLDAQDEYESYQYAFGGLNDVLTAFGDQLCGALRIPRTRLFGESPGGLNSTGESDMQGYEQDIASAQNSTLRRPLNTLFQVIHRSVLGRPPQTGAVQHAMPSQEQPLLEKPGLKVSVTHDLAPPEKQDDKPPPDAKAQQPPPKPPQQPAQEGMGQQPRPHNLQQGPTGTFTFIFRPLREMTEKEKGEIVAQTSTAIVQAFEAGIIDRARALAELKQQGEVTGVFTTIDAADMQDAEMDPSISEQNQMEQLNAANPFGGFGGEPGGKPPVPHLEGKGEPGPKPSLNAQGGNVKSFPPKRLGAPVT
jgi:uncharacterized protein